jgi:hypothetical protein
MFHLDVVKVDLVLHMLLWLYTCFKCFVCFRHMLQVFYLDVSKVDPRRAHVAMAVVAGGQRLAAAAYLCYCYVHVGAGNGAGSEWSPRMRGHG